ncbi:MAG: hypothetical protein U9O87_02365 [Verrucomicrobiota bacterium]|nr:hypothetical protein [Verrucomicrobiota bacterium]
MKHSKKYKSYFTLIELLTAMGIFVILMFVIFSFFSNAQKLWSITNKNTRIYENARIAFEVIGRDLQNAVANENIKFLDGTSGDDELYFVSASADSEEKSKLLEIGYKHNSTSNTLRRVIVQESTSTSPSQWDFYNKDDYYDPLTIKYQTVINGVETLIFSCLNSDLTAYDVVADFDHVPGLVAISLTLNDSDLLADGIPEALRAKSRRTFRKVIHLSNR